MVQLIIKTSELDVMIKEFMNSSKLIGVVLCKRKTLETYLAIGKKAEMNLMLMQAGDVKATFADTVQLESWILFKSRVELLMSIKRFTSWYAGEYFNVINNTFRNTQE